MFLRFFNRICDRYSEPSTLQQRDVDDVIADITDFFIEQPFFGQDLLIWLFLNPRHFVQVSYTQLLRARSNDRRLSPGYDRDRKTGALGHNHRVTVFDIKTLSLIPVRKKDDPSVGKHAVTVED